MRNSNNRTRKLPLSSPSPLPSPRRLVSLERLAAEAEKTARRNARCIDHDDPEWWKFPGVEAMKTAQHATIPKGTARRHKKIVPRRLTRRQRLSEALYDRVHPLMNLSWSTEPPARKKKTARFSARKKNTRPAVRVGGERKSKKIKRHTKKRSNKQKKAYRRR